MIDNKLISVDYNKMCQWEDAVKHIKILIKEGQGEVKTLKEMAKRIGLEESALSRRLKTTPGRKDELTLKEFLKISKILNVDPSFLLKSDKNVDSADGMKEIFRPLIREGIIDSIGIIMEILKPVIKEWVVEELKK